MDRGCVDWWSAAAENQSRRRVIPNLRRKRFSGQGRGVLRRWRVRRGKWFNGAAARPQCQTTRSCQVARRSVRSTYRCRGAGHGPRTARSRRIVADRRGHLNLLAEAGLAGWCAGRAGELGWKTRVGVGSLRVPASRLPLFAGRQNCPALAPSVRWVPSPRPGRLRTVQGGGGCRPLPPSAFSTSSLP